MIPVAFLIGLAVGIVAGAFAAEIGRWLSYRTEQHERNGWPLP